MKARLLAALLTVLVFALGFGAGFWVQRHRPLLGPPVGFLGEIKSRSFDLHLPLDDTAIKEINSEIERMKPEIDAFQKKIDALNQDFSQRLSALLTPPQRELLEKLHQHHLEMRARHPHGPTIQPSPGGGATLTLPFMAEPVEGLTAIVVVPLSFDRLSDELKLTDEQKPAVRQLLLERREKFLTLIDTTPPPSIRFNRLAPLIKKFATPPTPPAEKPKE